MFRLYELFKDIAEMFDVDLPDELEDSNNSRPNQ